jgi:hypothetical protein
MSIIVQFEVARRYHRFTARTANFAGDRFGAGAVAAMDDDSAAFLCEAACAFGADARAAAGDQSSLAG